MANTLYDHGRELFATGGIDWNSANLKAILVTSSYVPNLATDQFLSVIAGGDIISSGVALTGLSSNAGVCSANPIVFLGVTSGDVATYLIIYVDTGSSSTSPLIALINVAVGLPLTSTGGNITCTFFGNEVFEL
jgi:hypothetical protein